MSSSTQPKPSRKSRPTWLIIAIIIAIVVVVTVAMGFIFLGGGPDPVDNTDGSNGGQNNDGGSNNTGDNGTIDPLRQLGLKVGDYVEYTGESEMLGIKQGITIRLTVIEVTESDYLIQLSMSGAMSQEGTYRANSTEDLIAGMSGERITQGTLLGSEVLSTPYGNKNVEHWRSSTSTDSATNVTDYYVGNGTTMIYRIVMQSTGTDLLHITTRTNVVLSDTNIDKVKTGDAA